MTSAVSTALAEGLGPALSGVDPAVRRSERADFQSTVALAVAARAGRPGPPNARDRGDPLGPMWAEGCGAGLV